MDDLKAVAARALACLDLTDLSDDCDAAAIEALCARAKTPFGPVAAVCIWPRFVAQAKVLLANSGVRIATVVNFPSGAEPYGDVQAATRQAVADGADEIDMVIPYFALLEGHPENTVSLVTRVKSDAAPARLKAILETGVLGKSDMILQAAIAAIEGGADFIKTSTGKVRVNATPGAAKIMLEAIAATTRPVGFKPAGGVKTVQDAKIYLDLCDEIMGADWAGPETFRIGASGVLAALLATLSDETTGETGADY